MKRKGKRPRNGTGENQFLSCHKQGNKQVLPKMALETIYRKKRTFSHQEEKRNVMTGKNKLEIKRYKVSSLRTNIAMCILRVMDFLSGFKTKFRIHSDNFMN